MKQINKNNSKLKSSKNFEKNKNIINKYILKESEIIVRSILEKVISLVISNIFKNTIEKNIVNFCISEMRNRIDNIIGLQFIKHDKDDLAKRKIIKNKSQKYLLNNKNKLLFNNEEIQKLNKSQIIQEYELNESLNPYYSYQFENKKILKILIRKHINQNNVDIIDNNKKINNNIVISEEIIGNNFWETINQPKTIKIDRGASTKIKVDTDVFKRIYLEHIPEDIKEENKEILEIKQITPNIKANKNNNLKIRIEKNENKNKKQKKIKITIPNDLPSFDIEPEKLFLNEENESIKILRKEYEDRLARKKEKEEREKKVNQKKIEKEDDNNNNNNKPNSNTNCNIVKIKPIKIENLIAEFKGLKSRTKEIGKITDSNIDSQSKREGNSKNVKIEINDNPNYQFTEEKTDRKRKKHNHHNQNNNEINTQIQNNIGVKKYKNEKIREYEIMERTGSKFASGSNYNLMQLECGVDLTENKKKKSGGKNFYEKYGKFSYDLYQSKLNKTASDNFFETNYKNIINNSKINEEKEDNKKNNDIKNIKRKIKEYISDKSLIRENSDYQAKFEITNPSNNYLKLKTRNLKIVMNNLDLMKDFELNIDSDRKHKSNIKYNYFKNKINKSFKRNKKDLREINDFNKTVLKNNLWGEPNESNIKENNYYLNLPHHNFHNIRHNIQYPIIGLPRERLPPISNIRVHHYNAIKTEIKKSLGKEKIKNFSKNNIYIDKKKTFYL